MASTSFTRPSGDIITLLDLTPRDAQDNTFFPLSAQQSWFTRDSTRRHTPFVPVLQDFQYRGPGAFGQRFSFDLASQTSGDLMMGAVLQVQLTHWLDLTTVLRLQDGTLAYTDPTQAWFYANALGQILIQKVELEIDGVTIEETDGDFSSVFSALFPDLNTQFGLATDHLGVVSMDRLIIWPPNRIFPTENGYLHCLLPLFFQRTRLKEAFPLIACKEGSVRIHVTLRPFKEIVRQARGFRDTCDSVPIETPISFYDLTGPYKTQVIKTTAESEPQIQTIRLLTWGAMLDGSVRSAIIKKPFEIMHRGVETFYFDEPLKYATTKASSSDTVTIQLPLEANHPIEEIVWFIRRTDVRNNNEWTNYSSTLESEYDPVFNPRGPMLINARIQANGNDLVQAEEQYFRNLISQHHRGGIVSFSNFIYGYPIAKHPGDTHQPSGTINASRLQSLRLTLEVRTPVKGATWEVKVFCLGLHWLRFQNGLANTMFTD
jgi:hypothetical protein